MDKKINSRSVRKKKIYNLCENCFDEKLFNNVYDENVVVHLSNPWDNSTSATVPSSASSPSDPKSRLKTQAPITSKQEYWNRFWKPLANGIFGGDTSVKEELKVFAAIKKHPYILVAGEYDTVNKELNKPQAVDNTKVYRGERIGGSAGNRTGLPPLKKKKKYSNNDEILLDAAVNVDFVSATGNYVFDLKSNAEFKDVAQAFWFWFFGEQTDDIIKRLVDRVGDESVDGNGKKRQLPKQLFMRFGCFWRFETMAEDKDPSSSKVIEVFELVDVVSLLAQLFFFSPTDCDLLKSESLKPEQILIKIITGGRWNPPGRLFLFTKEVREHYGGSIPGPATKDGIVSLDDFVSDDKLAGDLATNHDKQLQMYASESAKSNDLLERMIFEGLPAFKEGAMMKDASGDGSCEKEGFKKMGMDRYWDVEKMLWHGPYGIGSAIGLKEFEDFHQKPFLQAFPDRIGAHHVSRFSEMAYSCSCGWPSIFATLSKTGYLGVVADSPIKMEQRCMDWWRRENDKLVENWVFLDIIDMWRQIGFDFWMELLRVL